MSAVAIILAVAAAIVFGIAAVTQHRAVRAASTAGTQLLSMRQIATVLADPGWRYGFALMVIGTGLHVTALSLAPISLTQPINVVAVPTTIVVGTALTRRPPTRSAVLATLAVVVGVALVVTSLSEATSGETPSSASLGGAAVVLAATTGLLHLAARLLLTRASGTSHWGGPMLLAVAGAANFATASAIFRLLAQSLHVRPSLPPAVVIALSCAVPVALALGAWSIHQAYAAGAAAAVTATSALTDPLVAVVLGVAVLGETHPLSAGRGLLLATAAALAGTGVVQLNRHHQPLDPAAPPNPPTLTNPTLTEPTRTHRSGQDLDAHLARR